MVLNSFYHFSFLAWSPSCRAFLTSCDWWFLGSSFISLIFESNDWSTWFLWQPCQLFCCRNGFNLGVPAHLRKVFQLKHAVTMICPYLLKLAIHSSSLFLSLCFLWMSFYEVITWNVEVLLPGTWFRDHHIQSSIQSSATAGNVPKPQACRGKCYDECYDDVGFQLLLNVHGMQLQNHIFSDSFRICHPGSRSSPTTEVIIWKWECSCWYLGGADESGDQGTSPTFSRLSTAYF